MLTLASCTQAVMLRRFRRGFRGQGLALDVIRASRKLFPKCDSPLGSGDLTLTGQYDEYVQNFEALEAITAELKLVIAGNHVTGPVLPIYGYGICQLLVKRYRLKRLKLGALAPITCNFIIHNAY